MEEVLEAARMEGPARPPEGGAAAAGARQNRAAPRHGGGYQKAAEAGNYHAMEHLGYLYEKGLGVTQDYAQARQWYQKAAEAGNAGARQALSRLP